MKYLLMCLCLLFDIVYISCKKRKRYLIGLIAKCLAAMCFILIAYMANKENPSTFKYYILIGLVLDGIGDLFLALRNLLLKNVMFFAGAIAFLFGHITYIRALFLINNDYRIECIIFAVILGAILFMIMDNACRIPKPIRYVGIVYCIMIVMMACFAVGVYITYKSSSNLVFMLGALLFVSSDCILILDNFSRGESWMHPVYSLLYFLGQILISFSLHL